MSVYCGLKWRRGDSRPRRRPTRSRPLLHFFFFDLFRTSRSIDVRLSVSYPWKIFQLLGKVGLWDMIKNVTTKRSSLPWTIEWKFHGIQNRLAELHGSILNCLGPAIVHDSRSFRCSCVYFAAQYNVHHDDQQAGHLLSALRVERYTDAIIFPHNKMTHKYHWIAWSVRL